MTHPAIGCTRVSTGPQAKAYGQEVQAAEITAYAERQGYELLQIVPEVLSGKTELADRATVQQYFDLADQCPGLTFIFPRVDRIGRRAELILSIVRQLQQRGARVEVVGVPLDLQTKEGTLMLTVLAGVAEYDHANIRNNMEQGRRRKAQRGLWPHGSLPWGYEFERDGRGVTLLPRPVAANADAIRRAYQLALEGGETYVMRAMQGEGWPAPTQAGWNRKTVVHALTNPVYTGRKTYAGITIEFEPIIPPELFAQVQRVRQSRRGPTGTAGQRREGSPLLFAGHLRCVCGGSIGRDRDRTRAYGDRPAVYYDVYRCWRAKRPELRGAGPHFRQTRAERLEAWLWPLLVETLTDPARLAAIVGEQPVPEPPTARIAELEATIERAYEPLTAGAIGYTLEMAQNIARPYALELERLKNQAQQCRPVVDVSAQAQAFAEGLSGELTFEDKRELLSLLNIQITLGPDRIEGIALELP